MGRVLFRGPRPRWPISLAVLVVLFMGALPSGATVVDRGTYSGTESFSFDDCGFLVNVDVEFSGRYRIREGKHRNATAFFLLDNFSYTAVHTNPENGEWFLVRGNGVFNETKARRVEGSIFEFTSIEAGQPFVLEDSSGEIVLRDRGVIRRRILFDTEGDNEPGGTFIEILEEDVRGPHPGFIADECEVITELIG